MSDPLVLLLIAGIGVTVTLAAAVGAWAWPLRATSFGFLLVLLAETKYRTRASAAALAGSVDSQIVYEIALYGLLFVLLAVVVLRLRPSVHRLTPREWLLLGFSALALASVAWSSVPSITLVRACQFLLVLALASVSVRCLGPDGVRRALTVSVVAYVLVFAVMGLTLPFARSDYMDLGWWNGRFSWFAIHPITAGTLAGAGVVLLLAEALFVPRHRWTRVAGIPVIVLLPAVLLVLLGARSRGPIFATLVASTFLTFRRAFHPWLASLAAVGSLVLTMALIGVNASETFAGWLDESQISDNPALEFLVRGNSLDYMLSLGGRTKLWTEISELFLERPWAGWGYTGSRAVLLERFRWAAYAHNALAQTLLDLGIVGTLLLWPVFLRSLFTDLLKPRWAGSHAGQVRGFVFAGLLFVFAQSILAETFAGAPGYELLLVLSCLLVSERVRVPVSSPAVRRQRERENAPSTSWPAARQPVSSSESLRHAK